MANFENEEVTPEPLFNPIQLKGKEGMDPMEAQKALVDERMATFKKWEDWRRPLESIWSEVYRLFVAAGTGSHLPTRAHVTIPIVFQVIEAALPKLVTIIFGQPDWFSAQPRSAASTIPKAELEAQEELLNYQLEKANFFTKFVDFAKQLFLYGTSYLYVYQKVKREWVYERTAIREPKSVAGIVYEENALRWEKSLTYKVIDRRPEVDVLAIEDVYPDPDARTEEDAEGIFVASSTSKSELEELSTGQFPIYGNFDKVKEFLSGENKYQQQQFKIDKRSIRGTNQKPQSAAGDSIELLTYWGKYDLDGDGIKEECQLVFANRQVLIKAIRNPFEHQKRPVIRGVLFSVPLEWFGMGLIEPVIGLIHELITIRNQNIDMNNLIINRMWKVSAYADVDLDTLVASPNGIILTADMDGVDPIDQPPIPVSPLQMSEMIQADIENTTAPKSIQGAPSSGSLGRTARGAQLIINQALEKFGMGAKLIEESVVKKVLVMFKKLNEQFLDSDEIMQTFYGPVIRNRLSPESIRNDVDFKLLGVSETVNAEAAINQMIAFYNLAATNPAANTSLVLSEIWKKMKLSVPADQVVQLNPALLTSQAEQIPGMAGLMGGGQSSTNEGGTSAGSPPTDPTKMGQINENGASAPIA